MKKYVFVFIAAVVFAACDANKKDKVANVVVAGKDSTTVEVMGPVYNFGTIAQGEKVEYSFRFKNTGAKPLVITDAHATCGCTVPEKPEKPVMPGEIGFIKVVFDSEGKQGHQEKSIMISSNASPAFGNLKLTGEVKAK